MGGNVPADIMVRMENRPGALAEIAEALGKAGINIEGMCGFVGSGQAVGHLLVQDPAAARRALSAVCEVGEEREVLVVGLEDRPGALGDVARRMADAGVNVEIGYLTTKLEIVLAVSDIEKARAAV
jgi:hypothetical protein